MKYDLYYDSRGAGKIHGCRWEPKGQPRGVIQFVHGIAEHIGCYESYARYLNAMGFVVVAEDHMGHGKSICEACSQGYFEGGWFTAIEDTCQLMRYTMGKYPGVPYVLYGHSMGSFMVRTILAKYPDSGISAAIISGTTFQSAVPKALGTVVKTLFRGMGEKKPSPTLQAMLFGSYNNRIDDAKTPCDWLSRDSRFVQRYIDDPLCGFAPTPGLAADMFQGLQYIHDPGNIAAMRKDLPVLIISGSMDPVGGYGKGVRDCAQAFRDAGMTRVSVKLYQDGRHVPHDELNRLEVYADVTNWLASHI